MEFDDLDGLFSKFNKNRFNKSDEDRKEMNEFLNNFVGRIENFEATGDDFKKIGELGEPDKVEEFKEGKMSFIKKTWKTEEGEYVLVEAIGGITGGDLDSLKEQLKENPFVKEINLEEKLAEAIEIENFEEAAELRDKIAERELMKG